MNVVTLKTQTVIVDGVEGLAPVTVFLTDLSTNKGKVVIECGGDGWANTWSWTNDMSISQWFVGLSPASIAANFNYFHRNEIDFSKLGKYAINEINKLLDSGKIDQDQATEILDIFIESDEFIREGLGSAWLTMNSELIGEALGENWHNSAPHKPSTDYAKIISIIKVAQAGVNNAAKEFKL